MEKGYHLLFSGSVQGIGFRYSARTHANRYGIGGWVKNCPDGRVQLYIQGEENILENFLNDINREFNDHIRSVERYESPPAAGCADFTIRF